MPELETLVGPFRFVDTRVEGASVELRYAIGEDWTFSETVEFDRELPRSPAMDRAVRVLHLVAGVSYYKCVAPAPLIVPALSEAERSLMEALYDQGLREFAYRNDLTVPLPVELIEEPSAAPLDEIDPDLRIDAGPLSGTLVPIGGGKDSALVASLVEDGLLFAVNPVGAHEGLAAALGRELIGATRTLDPALRDLVAAGVPNGHVPVTAITSAISVVAALSLGCGDVLMGIERSADEPSLVTSDGTPVNHQFSKSAEAEHLLRAVFDPTGVRYLSLLRPLTELAIGASVAMRGLGPAIVSCNRVFTVWNESAASREQRACGDCAKCLFTALMVAPCSTPDAIAEQYGRALLDEPGHVEPVRDLWSAEKPFDCVGERLETAAAIVLLAANEAWRDQIVVRSLSAEAAALLAEADVRPESFLTVEGEAVLPERYRGLIRSLAPALARVPGLTSASR